MRGLGDRLLALLIGAASGGLLLMNLRIYEVDAETRGVLAGVFTCLTIGMARVLMWRRAS